MLKMKGGGDTVPCIVIPKLYGEVFWCPVLEGWVAPGACLESHHLVGT